MAKSNQTKAKEISEATRRKVYERQKGRSISGAFLHSGNIEYHHAIFRGNQGIGYEWNIVAITSEEHRALHDKQPIVVNGRIRYTWQEFDSLIKNHLKLNYSGWSEEKCKYHKYWEEADYEVKRISQKQLHSK